jgi:hypothetical protein
MGRRVWALVVAAAVAITMVATGPARSATPASGTVDADTPEVRWSGSTAAMSAGLQEGPTGAGCIREIADPTCDFFSLTIGALAAPLDDVQVAFAARSTGLAEFDLYVYAPDGSVAASSTELGPSDDVVLHDPAPGVYTVGVQQVLTNEPGAAYDGVARSVQGSDAAPVDEESACGLEFSPELRELDATTGQGLGGVVGDPTAALDGTDRTQPVSLDVHVILDGVAQADAERLVATAARSYAPLNIQLRATSFEAHAFDTTDAPTIIREAKALLGGTRPAGVDIVEVLTTKDIVALGQAAVAGLADCIGGVAYDDRAFLVAEANTPSDLFVGPVVFDYEANPNVTAHEIGHLMGGQHHYANCVEGVQPSDVHADEGFVEVSPCTLMFNAADFLGPNFDTLNGAIVRGHAVRYAQP